MNRKTGMAIVVALAGGLLEGQEVVRFDHKVREDFFAGIGGNKEALDRAMKITDEVLAKDPNHAEALVWHGSGQPSQPRGSRLPRCASASREKD